MDKMYYGMAALEVSEGNIDPSLMVKAMSIADGEEKKGRAAYIELRAKELESEHRKTKVVSAVITTAAVAVAASTIAAKAITSDKAISAGKEAGKILLWLCLGFIGLLLIILFFENQAAKVANNYLDQQSTTAGTSDQSVNAINQPVVDNGDLDATNSLGEKFASGTGVAQDYERALYYFRVAAYKGHAKAQNNLALMLDGGLGIEEDDTSAAIWYKRSISQGYLDAGANLDAMFNENLKKNSKSTSTTSIATKNNIENEAAKQRFLDNTPDLQNGDFGLEQPRQ